MRLNWLDPAAQSAVLTNTNVQPLYDEVQFGLANTATTYVFTTGQSTRSIAQTNLAQPGQLSTPDQFVVRGVMLALRPRSSAPVGYLITSDSLQDIADFNRVLWGTLFTFTVNSTKSPVVYGHPALFPAGLGLQGMVTTGGATTSNVAYIAGNGVRDLGNRYDFGPGYAELLKAGETFRGGFSFDDGTVNLTASFSMKVFLVGYWSQASR